MNREIILLIIFSSCSTALGLQDTPSGKLQVNYHGFCKNSFTQGRDMVSMSNTNYNAQITLGQIAIDTKGNKTRGEARDFKQTTNLETSTDTPKKLSVQLKMNELDHELTVAKNPAQNTGLFFRSVQVHLLKDDHPELTADFVLTNEWQKIEGNENSTTWKNVLKNTSHTVTLDSLFKSPNEKFCFILNNTENKLINCSETDTKKICDSKKDASAYLIYSISYIPSGADEPPAQETTQSPTTKQ